MQRTTREVMLLAAWHIEKEAADIRECCTVDGIVWDEQEDQREYEKAMAIVRALRREAGVTWSVDPGVITPIGPEADWYDPAITLPEPLHDVLAVWRPMRDEDVVGVYQAYRRLDGRWVLSDDLSYTDIEPLAWTPRPRIPKWVEDVR